MIPIWKLSGRLGNQMFRHAYIYSQVRQGNIPDEYVQDPAHFDKYSNAIKIMFGGGIGDDPRVCVQVRRGDYVNNSFYFDLMSIDFYQKAMAMFPDRKFLVFSDDIEWCKRQEMFEGCDFNYNGEDWEDINRMASCHGHIIANGTFGWWGAYLSPHGDKVICPDVKEHWYTDKVIRTKVPKEWIQM